MICTQPELWTNNLALILKVSRIGASLIITKKQTTFPKERLYS